MMRYLFRLNVISGSGRRAGVPGYLVGGKTGTAEKIENGVYVSNKRRNSFLSAFPMDNPRYVVLVLLDEPKPESEGRGCHGRVERCADCGIDHSPLGAHARGHAKVR